jgi:hypothetical protein
MRSSRPARRALRLVSLSAAWSLSSLATTGASAEVFLGVEAGDNAPTSSAEPSPVEPGKVMRKETTRPAAERAPVAMEGDFDVTGGLDASANTVGGALTGIYSFNRYAALELTGRYARYARGDVVGEQWGPDVAGVIRGPNPTIVTPFVGAGPGFVKWRRTDGSEVYDSSHAFTASAFGGFNVRLTRHFGIEAVRRQTAYFADPPKSFDDRETREARITIANQIGFHVFF